MTQQGIPSHHALVRLTRKAFAAGTIVVLLLALFGCKRDREHGQASVYDDFVREAARESRTGKAFMESETRAKMPVTLGQLRAAKQYVEENPDLSSYHLLLLLRQQAPDLYASISPSTKAAVLCAGLEQNRFLNDWGNLKPAGSFDRSAATALVETGKTCMPYLRRLLDDKRAAPLFGSAEATTSHVYRYRRADFAYRYAMLILKRDPDFDQDANERDRSIMGLKKELNQSGGNQ